MYARRQQQQQQPLAKDEDSGSYVVNLGHNQYIHIKDKNTNTTRYLDNT